MAGFKLDDHIALSHECAHDRLRFIEDQMAWRNATFTEQEPRRWVGRDHFSGYQINGPYYCAKYTLAPGTLTSIDGHDWFDESWPPHLRDQLMRTRIAGSGSNPDCTSRMLSTGGNWAWEDALDAIAYLHFDNMELHVRSLTSGELRASVPLPSVDPPESERELDLLGISPNHCAILHSDQAVRIINWRTGQLISEFFIPGPYGPSKFKFLSDTSFITLGTPECSGKYLGRIELYDFAHKKNKLPSRGSRVANFWLPRLVSSEARLTYHLYFEKSSTNTFAPDDCIIAFRSQLLSPDDPPHHTQATCHVFVTPKQSILSILRGPRSASVCNFQWGQWGLPGVRCIPSQHGPAVGIFRDRLLLLPSEGERHLLDFNQRRVRHAQCANSNPKLWPSGRGCFTPTNCRTIPEGIFDPLGKHDAAGAERLPFVATPWSSAIGQCLPDIVMSDKHVVFVGPHDFARNKHYKFPVYTHTLVYPSSSWQDSEEVKTGDV